jgi:Icc-related predicted phosphoesterase
MKYKVGDKVRVRKDFDSELPGRLRFCGKTVTIKTVCETEGDYEIEEDRIYYWTDEMFEDLVKARKEKKQPCIVTWVEKNEDPFEYFDYLSDAKEKIDELMEDEDVDKTSIKLYMVSKVSTVKTSYKLIEEK